MLVLPVVLVVDIYVYVYVIHKQGVHHNHHMLSKSTTISALRKPNELAAWNKDEDLSLVKSDLVSVLKGNYADEVGQFVCYTKAKASAYGRASNTSALNHAQKASEIKKIVPWDCSCPLPEFFASILEVRGGSMDKDQD
jgi:hypothetical protein